MQRRGLPQPVTTKMLVEGMQSSYRTGFRLKGIDDEHGESTWTHSRDRLKASALLYAQWVRRELDREWLRTRSPWHDLPDYDLVDITPHDGISDEEQDRLEYEVAVWATAKLGRQGSRLLQYFLEAKDKQRPEARVLYELDKIEPCIEALQYERDSRYRESMQEFFPYAQGKLTCPVLRGTLEKLLQREYDASPREQYHLLLKLAGDLEKFDAIMRDLKRRLP